MDNEEWKKVSYSDGCYVSNLGNVRIVGNNGFEFKARIKKTNSNGDPMVYFLSNGSSTRRPLKKLVAELFLKNPNGFYSVWHKDLNKFNNSSSNLEWISKIEYTRRDYKISGKTAPKKRNVDKSTIWNSRPVLQMDIEGNVLKRFESSAEAGRRENLMRSLILKVCHGNGITHGGYKWAFEDEYLERKPIYERPEPIDIRGEIISKWRRILLMDRNMDINDVLKIVSRASNIFLGIQEEWKDVYGYEESYVVNNFGSVVSKERYVLAKNGKYIYKKSTILRQSVCGGYCSVTLSKDNKPKTMKSHRVLCDSFMNGIDPFLVVNHLDMDKTNNYLGNLEICSKSRNGRHAVVNDKKTARNKYKKSGINIVQLTHDYVKIAEYESIALASKSTGINPSSIGKCASGMQEYAGAFRWMHMSSYLDFIK